MRPHYHVYLGERRTTVSLHPTLAELLALRLDRQPDSASAHRAIRHWLQQQLDDAYDPGRCQVSQWLQSQVIFEIVDTNLSRRYADWLLKADK